MEVEYETKAIKDLKALDGKTRSHILAKVDQYAAQPESLTNNVTRLVGSPFHRLRVGDYRVIFALNGEVATIMTVLRVRHRREAYD